MTRVDENRTAHFTPTEDHLPLGDSDRCERKKTARDKTTATILLALTLLLSAPGCGPMIASLDVSVDAVRLALTQGNHAGLMAISHPDLAQAITPTKLAEVSRGIARFGEFKKRKFRSFSTHQNGPLEARYLLVYEKAHVDLKIALEEGKLVYLQFKPTARVALASRESS